MAKAGRRSGGGAVAVRRTYARRTIPRSLPQSTVQAVVARAMAKNSEQKYCDMFLVNASTNVPAGLGTNSFIFVLNGIQQGAGQYNRIGNKVNLQSLKCELNFTHTYSQDPGLANAIRGNMVRIVCFGIKKVLAILHQHSIKSLEKSIKMVHLAARSWVALCHIWNIVSSFFMMRWFKWRLIATTLLCLVLLILRLCQSLWAITIKVDSSSIWQRSSCKQSTLEQPILSPLPTSHQASYIWQFVLWIWEFRTQILSIFWQTMDHVCDTLTLNGLVNKSRIRFDETSTFIARTCALRAPWACARWL